MRATLPVISIVLAIFAPVLARGDDAATGGVTEVVISVADQKLCVLRNGKSVSAFPVSTSKFGIGDQFGSYRTPVGQMTVSAKIGASLPSGSVLKGRKPTGEVLPPNAPGRDPIVSRILCLRGNDAENQNAENRGIYIHGTPQERFVGRRASYGCIRMKSRDVIALFDKVPMGAVVVISEQSLRRIVKARRVKAPIDVAVGRATATKARSDG